MTIPITVRRYLADPALVGTARMVELLERDGKPVARLADTWFHPQGGGQKGDRGMLGPAEVLDVRPGPDGTVDHFLSSASGLAAGTEYPFAVDASWRRLNSTLHSAGHLLAGVTERLLPGLRATAGHHWPGECRVEFTGEALDRIAAATTAIEAAAVLDIDRALPVRIVGDPFRDRACQVGDYAPISCGGTHVSDTGQVRALRLRSVKVKNGLARVGYDVLA